MPPPHQSARSPRSIGGSASFVTKLGFMDLPLETQKEIVKHVLFRKDLLAIQCVSRHFHRLASARLYSELRFTLTHADSQSYYSLACTRLADALHTFATSEHDYGQFVRNFTLTLSERDTEDVQKRVLSKYHWEEEANRLLNTTLLLMLRKTRMLEVFGWDTAIELSGQVYQALSKIQTLQTVLIRLDTSMIPRIASVTQLGVGQGPVLMPNQNQNPGGFGLLTQGSHATGSSNPTSVTPIIAMHKKGNPHMAGNDKLKFSGFKDLRQLDILGIDNLGFLPDISTCVLACSGTLKSLKLSLSIELARKARKPLAPSAPINPAAQEAMDDEESEDMTPPPQPSSTIPPAPINEADIKKEKAAQESILALVFGLETQHDDKRVDRTLRATAASFKTKENADEIFLENMKNFLGKLVQAKSSLGYKVVAGDKTVLKDLDKAIKKYLHSNSTKVKKPKTMLSSASKTIANGAITIPGTSSHASKAGTAGLLPNHQHTTLDDFDFENFLQSKGGKLPAQSTSGANSMSPYLGFPHFVAGHASSSGPPMSHYTAPTHLHNHSSSSTGYHSQAHVGADNELSWGDKTISEHMKKPLHQLKQEMMNGKLSQELYWALKFDKAEEAYGKWVHEDNPKAIQQMLADEAKKSVELTDMDTESELSGPEEDAVANESLQAGGVAASSSTTPTPYFPAILPDAQDREDDMDIDMEHPDIIDSDEEDLQGTPQVGIDPQALQEAELLLGISSAQTAPSDPKPIEEVERISSVKKPARSVSRVTVLKYTQKKNKSTDETMQEYIRTKHGFHLEELTLYLIPLKPSVIGRALDLSCLRQLTLLSVGPQGGFWSFVAKIQKESSVIQLHYIHTDDVSMAFLNCLAHLNGLQDLFLMRRAAKENDAFSITPPGSIADIRLALRKHIATLQTLMIMNNEDESWDLDTKMLRLLTVKAAVLNELSFSVNIADYHVFMQGIPGLKSLRALHLFAVRTTDPCVSITRECRKFTIDNISHCPDLKIRYLAMAGVVFELARRPHSRPTNKAADVKGKSKAMVGEANPIVDPSTDSDDFSEIESGGLEIACVKHLKFAEVPSIKIFHKNIRTGKL
ncbi:hypothetical protein MMC13_006125 [Lambiella insularis]|nr:hypothetical protein [Lambiella insularis]